MEQKNQEEDINQQDLDQFFKETLTEDSCELDKQQQQELEQEFKPTNLKVSNLPDIRVLFITGLESGINGKKAKVIRKNFKNCCIPDIQASAFNVKKKNAVFRKFLTNFFRIKKAGMDTLQSCVDIVSQEIKEFKPDIVVGMSMGGAILSALLSGLSNSTFKGENIKNEIWNGPCLLIAPALQTFLRKTTNREQNATWKQNFSQLTKNNKNIHIIHGTNDKTVPYSESIDLINNYAKHVTFHKVEEGDHKLNDYLIKNLNLVEKIYQVYFESLN